MTTEEILTEITSRDTTKVKTASCYIITIGQESEKIKPLIPHLSEITNKTKGLNMGGAIAPNQRFIDFAIKTIQFHKTQIECPCHLYDDTYECFDPKKEEKNGFVEINSEVCENYSSDFLVTCTRCKMEFDVIEREYHYTWWKWTKKQN